MVEIHQQYLKKLLLQLTNQFQPNIINYHWEEGIQTLSKKGPSHFSKGNYTNKLNNTLTIKI